MLEQEVAVDMRFVDLPDPSFQDVIPHLEPFKRYSHSGK